MLVLSRKPGEKILIGDSITVTIVRIGPNTVRIGIEAPRDINVARGDLDPIDRPGETEYREIEIASTQVAYLGIDAKPELFVEGERYRIDASEFDNLQANLITIDDETA